MAAKTRFVLNVDDSVLGNSSETDETAVIPTGEVWDLEVFGGSEVGAGDNVASQILLQEWDGVSWTTIRLLGLASVAYELDLKRSYVGDGVKKLRLRRVNKTASAKRIAAYIEGIKITI
jgi:hypothetical protein